MTESGTSTPTRLSVALTWMPVQLVLLFVALAAVDLACQVLGALLVHHVPAMVRDAARLGSALLLSAVMIAAYRWLVRSVERRRPDELGTPMAARYGCRSDCTSAGILRKAAFLVPRSRAGSTPVLLSRRFTGRLSSLAVPLVPKHRSLP
jgi:hypothetical protein